MSFTNSIIITGGTAGLGYEASQIIAKARPDCLVVLCSRSDKLHAADTINKALHQSNAIFLPLDLSSTANVRTFAQKWLSDKRPPINGLVLNAGLQFPGSLTKTEIGVEATFAVNHIGHALLFHLLYPSLTADARIVITSSGTHDPDQKSGIPDAKYTSAKDLAYPPSDMIEVPGRQRYSSSKLANMLWAYALDRHLNAKAKGQSSRQMVNAFDPGLMPGTGLAREASSVERFLWNHVLPRIIPLLRVLISPNIHTAKESGAALARLAVDGDVEGQTGLYFEGLQVTKSSTVSYDEEKQRDLWDWTVTHLAQSEEEKLKFDL